jgi:TfoX/Sxy family transcriptional regulator of competence genes
VEGSRDVAYDEILADLVRHILANAEGEVTERKMFGGLTFLLNGNMVAGVVGGELMVRLGEAGAEAALHREYVRKMDFTGRPMPAMVYIERDGLQGTALEEWLAAAADFVLGLPPKNP